MAYVKPGVEITQRQQTVSPVLTNPDLYAAIVGPSYQVVEISDSGRTTDFTHDYGVTVATGATTAINLFSGVSFSTTSLTVDSSSIYVDIVGKLNNALKGTRLHIPPGHAGLSYDAPSTTLTINRTLLSGIANMTSSDYLISGSISIGWRALNSGYVGQCIPVESITDVEGFAGKIGPENPLAFGLNQSIANSNRLTYAVPMAGIDNGDHTAALNILAAKEVYAIAPMDFLTSAQATTYGTHCTTRSAATEKMERIAFTCIDPSITGTASADATTIASIGTSIANKRLFYVHPVLGYYSAKVHISQLHPNYVTNVFLAGKIGSYENVRPILNQRVQVTNSAGGQVTYFSGQEITAAVWSGMAHATTGSVDYVEALVPVPGYYWAAAVAGQVAGQAPQQGFTNLPIAGSMTRVKYSNDYFTQTQLNEIATGGTYIIHQSTPQAAPSCRHQLSTDMSSIELRELNITKVLDYTAKLIRNTLTPFIGRYNITPEFLKVMTMSLNSIGDRLVREGVIIGMRVLQVAQSTTERDNVLVTVEVQVPYPVNYIKITLTF